MPPFSGRMSVLTDSVTLLSLMMPLNTNLKQQYNIMEISPVQSPPPLPVWFSPPHLSLRLLSSGPSDAQEPPPVLAVSWPHADVGAG